MFSKCSYVLEMQKGWFAKVHVFNVSNLWKIEKNKTKRKTLYCNKTKYFLCYNLICVLSFCKEDSAKEKGSSIPKVFEILSNFKVFLTGFQTTKFYVTTWKLLRTLRQNSPIKFALAQK